VTRVFILLYGSFASSQVYFEDENRPYTIYIAAEPRALEPRCSYWKYRRQWSAFAG